MALSVELEKAKQLAETGKYKKALGTLWAVEAKARMNFAEAQGLVDVATSIRDHLSGRALTECQQLLSLGSAAVTQLASDPRTGALVVIANCRCVGGSGHDIEPGEAKVDMIFHQEEVRLAQLDRLARIPYASVTSLQVGKPAVSENTRSKATRTAFQIGAAVLSPTSLLLAKAGKSTGIALRAPAVEVFLLHVSETSPDEWRRRLSEVFLRIEQSCSVTGDSQPKASVSDVQSESSSVDPDVVATLERLARLREQGVISDDELQRLKAEILAGR